MRDATLDDLGGQVGIERRLGYADGTLRRVFVVDREVPFPDGRLIVSRTDLTGVITRENDSFVSMSGWSMHEAVYAAMG